MGVPASEIMPRIRFYDLDEPFPFGFGDDARGAHGSIYHIRFILGVDNMLNDISASRLQTFLNGTFVRGYCINQYARLSFRKRLLKVSEKRNHDFHFQLIERSRRIVERIIDFARLSNKNFMPTAFLDLLRELISLGRMNEFGISHVHCIEPSSIFFLGRHHGNDERTDDASASGFIDTGVKSLGAHRGMMRWEEGLGKDVRIYC